MTPFQRRVGRVTVQWMTGLNNVAYRLSNGRVAGNVPSGAPICLLTTTGRLSGRPRTVPLLYVPLADGEMALVASRGGMPDNPAWFLNLQANPRAVAQVGPARLDVVARVVEGDEREALWPRLTAAYPHFDAYTSRTDRVIPVLVLTPVHA
jgi:F420H(2)-dependent quinone reductase